MKGRKACAKSTSVHAWQRKSAWQNTRTCLTSGEVCLSATTNSLRAQPAGNAAAVPNAPGRLYKANGEFKPDTLMKDSSAGQYKFWRRQFKRYYATSNMDLAPIGDQRGHLEKCIDAQLGTAITSDRDINEETRIWPAGADCTTNCINALDKLFLKSTPSGQTEGSIPLQANSRPENVPAHH